MTHNKKIEKPKLIIGEGKEDFLFFYSLFQISTLSRSWCIELFVDNYLILTHWRK